MSPVGVEDPLDIADDVASGLRLGGGRGSILQRRSDELGAHMIGNQAHIL